MLSKVTLIALLLAAAIPAAGQNRRTKRPRPTPSQPATKQKEPTDDPNTIHLLYSEDGRDYYFFQVAKVPDADAVFYSYVVVFDQSTPAGRSALTRARALAKLTIVDMDQLYYVAAIQYQCFFKLNEPTKPLYVAVIWTDTDGNEITKLQIKPEDSGTVANQVAEIATYSEPYMQKVFDTLEESSEAQRRNFESRMQLAITLGQEAEARRMKFEPRVPNYVPALSLVVAGGAKHMFELLKASKQTYDKTTRNAK
jgi:hypothetical protein